MRVGIIGCGNISETYFNCQNIYNNFKVVACADIHIDTAKKKAKKYNIKAQSVDDILASREVDLIVNLTIPYAHKEIIINSPSILRKNQSEFAKTGGIHASGMFSSDGSLISLREDVGRHNALDKMIGDSLFNNLLQPNDQFVTCSGRLNFELVQKVLMTDIGVMIGVGAPTSLAIDLANRFDMTLIGFVKENSFNIYTNNQKVIVD